MRSPSSRHKDGYAKRIEDFTDSILVHCPRCNQKAIVVYQKPTADSPERAPLKKVTCVSCGYNQSEQQQISVTLTTNSKNILSKKYIVLGLPIDPFFHLPLYLVMDCCKNQLWAYNGAHLSFLKSHVAATLRERDINEKQNNSIGSRLPRWMSAAKNREPVLKAISILESRL